jgi:cell division septation protein DedD
MKGRIRSRILGYLLTPVLALMPTGPGAAQTPETAAELRAVEAAMVEGDFDRARTLVEAWSEGTVPGTDRLSQQHGLWLQAVLTVDPDGAELLYRRLILEHPGGAWSDQALLRLARGAEARDEPEVAERYLQILVRDYPASPSRVEARAQLARMASAGAPSPVRPQATPPTSDRPATPPAPPSAPPATAGTTEPAPTPAGTYTVQLGAFGTRERAEAFAAELRLAGMDVRVVQVEGSPLFRVRTGSFAERAAAEARADELDARGFEAFVSADRDRERPVA